MKCFGVLGALLFLVALPSPAHALIKCKRGIMNSFYLTGMKYSIVEPMYICPHVHDKCCTLADEVKIKHLIEKHTQPILERRVALVMRSIGSILDSFMTLVNINPSLMVLNYSIPRAVPIKDKRCESTPRSIPTRAEDKAYMRYHNGSNKYVRRKSIDAFLRIGKYDPKLKKKKGRRRRRELSEADPKRVKRVHRPNHFQIDRSLRKKHHYQSFSHNTLFQTQTSTVSTTCTTREELMYRDFVIVNQDKVKYCVGLHDAFLDMNLKLFIRYLSNVKMSMSKLVSMKNTLYCSICDAHKHQFFREKEKEIVMSKHFCQKTLKTEKDYFMFMHVFLVEFLNQVLQYLACFETDGHVFEFPFPSFMVKYTRRIRFVKACLNSVDDKKHFYKNCYMICRQFSLTHFSAFFEGDFELFKRVNVGLHSFMRKYRRGEKLQNSHNDKMLKKFGVKERANKALLAEISLPENVDGILLEPFGPHSGITNRKFYFDDDDRVRLYSTTNTEKFSYYYDPKDKKDIKILKKAKKAIKLAKTKKAKLKLLKLMKKVKKKKLKTIKWVPPKKKKHKLPLKKMVYGASGILDRLSTRLFKEHLKKGLYPQRGHHKIHKKHWKFTKHKAHYIATMKEVARRAKAKALRLKREKAKRAALAKKKKAKKAKKGKKPKKKKGRVLAAKKKKKPAKPVKGGKKGGKKKPKKGKKGKKPKKKKNPFAVEDRIKTKMSHKAYRDVISSPNTHAPRKMPPKPKSMDEPALFVEKLNQIFEKVEEKSRVLEFFHEYEKEGLDPLHDLDHVDFRYNTTRLIEKRFEIPEKLDRSVVTQYMGTSRDHIKEFNEEMEDVKVDDYETIDEKVREIKDLRKVLGELTKTGGSPMEMMKINTEINRLQKAVMENEARRKVFDKAMKRRRNRQGHSDLNHNKHPDHHHHLDLYYNDTFAGIAHMFELVFGT